MSTHTEPITIVLPEEPCIIVAHGGYTVPHSFTDDYRGDAHDDMREQPIRRAVTVARLRALADMLEGGDA